MDRPKGPRKSEKQISEETEKLLESIAHLEEQARRLGQAFKSLTREQLERKIRQESADSPFITHWGGDSNPFRGSQANCRAGVYNPDPTYYYLYLSLFWGLWPYQGNDGLALAGRYAQWPVLTSEEFVLSSGQSKEVTFPYTVPAGIQPTTYIGNFVLWRDGYVGFTRDIRSFDRQTFDPIVR